MIKVQIQYQNEDKDIYFSRSWEIDSCYGPKKIYDNQTEKIIDQYENNRTYIDFCCIGPGTHILQCINSIGPYGWGKSFIEIHGQRYCDDFVGNKGLRRIVIEGM